MALEPFYAIITHAALAYHSVYLEMREEILTNTALKLLKLHGMTYQNLESSYKSI